jgi:hypothetical protein
MPAETGWNPGDLGRWLIEEKEDDGSDERVVNQGEDGWRMTTTDETKDDNRCYEKLLTFFSSVITIVVLKIKFPLTVKSSWGVSIARQAQVQEEFIKSKGYYLQLPRIPKAPRCGYTPRPPEAGLEEKLLFTDSTENAKFSLPK